MTDTAVFRIFCMGRNFVSCFLSSLKPRISVPVATLRRPIVLLSSYDVRYSDRTEPTECHSFIHYL